jgi:tetratricopeptide (TPR) repeat protein
VLRAREFYAAACEAREQGDLAGAIAAAREALVLRPDCSALHALLGHLHEQAGETETAQYHFTAALDVSSATEGECDRLLVPPAPEAAAPTQANWLTVALVACVLVSAVAIVYAFWGDAVRGRSLAATLQPMAPPDAAPRAWEWRTPEPAKPAPEPPKHVEPVAATNTTSATPATMTIAPPVTPVAAPADKPLGPSGRTHVRMARGASLEEADEAFFQCDYESATALYEAVIAQGAAVDPRVYRDLAWCYQHLGNSTAATKYLDAAITAYQAVLAQTPDDPAATQGLRTCEAAKRSLGTRTASAKP